MSSGYIKLGDIAVYKMAVEISKIGWEIYEEFDWHTKKIIGDQFITSVDSFGANFVQHHSQLLHTNSNTL